MPATVDIGTLIYKDPAMHGGRPCIAGTGTTVLAIVDLYEQGNSPADIKSEHFPHLPLEGIFAALTYWAANSEEIANYFREDELVHDEWLNSKG
jgi:uncharacterized protein (DUF433 family)